MLVVCCQIPVLYYRPHKSAAVFTPCDPSPHHPYFLSFQQEGNWFWKQSFEKRARSRWMTWLRSMCAYTGTRCLNTTSGKNTGEKLAGKKEQATQFGRLEEPQEEPSEKLCRDSIHQERRDGSLGKWDSDYSSLFPAAGSISQIYPLPPSPACSQKAVF